MHRRDRENAEKTNTKSAVNWIEKATCCKTEVQV
jgi:hypothetical protein